MDLWNGHFLRCASVFSCFCVTVCFEQRLLIGDWRYWFAYNMVALFCGERPSFFLAGLPPALGRKQTPSSGLLVG
jgi:hypothetical protein